MPGTPNRFVWVLGQTVVWFALACAGCRGSEPAKIELTHVPAYGGFDDLRGRVKNVRPADYRVAVYIFVRGWWNKPGWRQPLTPIAADGTWRTDITTGGVDEKATEIAAFLVPATCRPPRLRGDRALPGAFTDAALAVVRVTRKQARRAITFAEKEWFVKSSNGPTGPGPNVFSSHPANVWVDPKGRLHLKITRRRDAWLCAEVWSKRSFGRGTYTFRLATPAAQLDRSAVLGLFTYDPAPDQHHREIDVELSRWGKAGNQNAQFVVQPWNTAGNIKRFNLPGEPAGSVHQFRWGRENVAFQSTAGRASERWEYAGKDLPRPGSERVHINLWLVQGKAPADGRAVEAVIEAFEFKPEQPTSPPNR